MTASRLDILTRLEDLDVGLIGYDWPDVLDLMDEAGLIVDIPTPVDCGCFHLPRHNPGCPFATPYKVDAGTTGTTPPPGIAYVEASPGRMGGEVCIGGSRLTTATMRALRDNRGLDIDGTIALYPYLTREQVETALWWEDRCAGTTPETDDDWLATDSGPDRMEMIAQLRRAVGLFDGAMSITPKQAWEEALKAAESTAHPDRWFGEWRDRPDGYDQWRITGDEVWVTNLSAPFGPRSIVEARPVPQPTPRWTVEERNGDWVFQENGRVRSMSTVLAALNAHGKETDQ